LNNYESSRSNLNQIILLGLNVNFQQSWRTKSGLSSINLRHLFMNRESIIIEIVGFIRKTRLVRTFNGPSIPVIHMVVKQCCNRYIFEITKLHRSASTVAIHLQPLSATIGVYSWYLVATILSLASGEHMENQSELPSVKHFLADLIREHRTGIITYSHLPTERKSCDQTLYTQRNETSQLKELHA
jgi:hypothetical protein